MLFFKSQRGFLKGPFKFSTIILIGFIIFLLVIYIGFVIYQKKGAVNMAEMGQTVKGVSEFTGDII